MTNVDAKIDMTYRFLWDSEPTDEQLLTIMQEVGEEVRQSREKVARQVIENIRWESSASQQEVVDGKLSAK